MPFTFFEHLSVALPGLFLTAFCPGVRFAHPRLFSAAPPGLRILFRKRLAPEARQIIAPGEFTSPGLKFEDQEP